ncbi:Cof-type HAD-IIB family hydrolase [Paenibacillus sp. UNC451MF]|uniref:Cof-type HAD-IIB family hydrolase n=1 Tax=Paenibacillus sp. UNC451MF TaxID=1449063 RepID=UPI00049056CC|nr:Cof-type HAD-IIB family hydrolase [Paenibacillus sp. UNC451MF]
MKVSAIVLDLDGTLLNSRKKVSPRNLSAVLECYNRGIPIIIATARPPRSVKDLLPEQLRSIGVKIYYNGALVISEVLNLREHYPLDDSINAELIDYLISSESDPHLSVEVEDSWYSNRELDYTELMQIKTKPDIVGIEEMRQLAASKLLITNFKETGKLLEQFLHKVNIVITDSGSLIQISSKKASKENAVAQICERLGFLLEEVMVFGDDYNDLGLFRLCGFPIAMGNAIEELKDIAYEVTETNDHDGVAVLLERIIS